MKVWAPKLVSIKKPEAYFSFIQRHGIASEIVKKALHRPDR